MHRSGKWLSRLQFALILLSVFLISSDAFAQAKKTAERSSEFDVFGGFTYLQNAYRHPLPNYGVTLGGDYTRYIRSFRGLIIPSFQVRGTIAHGSAENQKTLAAGLKLATTYHHLHPYADFLFGNGVITFPLPPNPVPGVRYRVRDSTGIYIYGGGITYDFRPNLSLMVDYQRQYWNLGSAPNAPPDRFYPQAVTVGVVFHIPFKAYKTY